MSVSFVTLFIEDKDPINQSDPNKQTMYVQDKVRESRGEKHRA